MSINEQNDDQQWKPLKHNGNQSEASKMLGLNRGTLRTKLKEYDLLKINKK